MSFSLQSLSEWGTALMVFASGGMAGHYAAQGMSSAQWLGAFAAVLGSIALAVVIRVWPAPEVVRADQQD